MVEKLKRLKNIVHNRFGAYIEVLIYAIMLILICIYFEGNGQFIYEMVI